VLAAPWSGRSRCAKKVTFRNKRHSQLYRSRSHSRSPTDVIHTPQEDCRPIRQAPRRCLQRQAPVTSPHFHGNGRQAPVFTGTDRGHPVFELQVAMPRGRKQTPRSTHTGGLCACDPGSATAALRPAHRDGPSAATSVRSAVGHLRRTGHLCAAAGDQESHRTGLRTRCDTIEVILQHDRTSRRRGYQRRRSVVRHGASCAADRLRRRSR
jgi:hypothetical protein